MPEPTYHIPALLEQTLDGLNIHPDGVYLDCTYGGGGHSRAILERLSPLGHLYGIDQDRDAWKQRIIDKRFTFVLSNFAYMRNFMRYYEVDHVDGILADLGVSFHHFDDSRRGFSFRFDGELDMRMNQAASCDAKQIIASYSEEQLANIMYLYGELRQSRAIAAAIVKARAKQPILTTARLVEVVSPYIKPAREKQELAQLFQALRIEVNNELDVLRRLLNQSRKLLRPGGRLAIITYHSLEDRLVKNFIRTGNFEGRPEKDFYGRVNAPFEPVNNRVITPDDDEIQRNPRSRSAKLRIAQRTEN